MISLIARNGQTSERMTFNAAQQVALANRLSLVKVSEPALFKLVDLGRRKYLEKKTRSRQRLANRVVRKHVEIRSNIDARDLDIKLNSVSRFLRSSYRVSVMVRYLKLVMTKDVYDKFVSAIKGKISKLTPFFEGPIQTEAGDSMFYLCGDDLRGERLQVKD